MKIIFIIFSIFILISALFPIIKSDQWYIRAFDFPRVQIIVITLIYLITSLYYLDSTWLKVLVFLFCVVAFILDFYRIGPYLKVYPVESESSKSTTPPQIKILSANIFINNNQYNKFLNLIKEENPDIVLILEPDKKWLQAVSELEKQYGYNKLIPKDNTYGMLLYSKFPLNNTRIKNLIDDEVPSIFSEIQLVDGTMIEIICVHPRPPRPNESSSLQRDGELMAIAKYINEHPNHPIIVVGDFNDVAWSHTTRLFRTVSGTLDPRVGRGAFNTFPAKWKLLRVPLDHVFYTPQVAIRDIRVLKHIGSDHLPITASFDILKYDKSGAPDAPDQEDKKEYQEVSNKADEWDGPEKEVDKDSE